MLLPRRWYLANGPRASRAVCLTFDDGPHPDHTPRLLDVLKDVGVPATFFVVGERAKAHPDLIRRIVAEGHALGHHSYTHSKPAHTTTGQLLDEVRWTTDLLRNVVGHPSTLFRPPYGELTVRKALGLWRAGQQLVMWNVDPKDYLRHNPDELRTWFRHNPLRGGDVVLLHDNVPHALGVLSELVGTVRASGLGFVRLPDWTGRLTRPRPIGMHSGPRESER
jgi:peptidoglycan/xylan/chitin deacetylase (PgdA/CDA1 family)